MGDLFFLPNTQPEMPSGRITIFRCSTTDFNLNCQGFFPTLGAFVVTAWQTLYLTNSMTTTTLMQSSLVQFRRFSDRKKIFRTVLPFTFQISLLFLLVSVSVCLSLPLLRLYSGRADWRPYGFYSKLCRFSSRFRLAKASALFFFFFSSRRKMEKYFFFLLQAKIRRFFYNKSLYIRVFLTSDEEGRKRLVVEVAAISFDIAQWPFRGRPPK